MPPADPTPPADLEAMAGDVATLKRQLGELAGIVAELAGGGAPDAAVRPWLTESDPGPAAVMLDTLTRWLGQVWMHYPGHNGAVPLPECWAHHPWVIEELWAARGAYREATGEHGSYLKLADWHDRIRPGVAERLAARVGSCSRHLHPAGSASDDPPRSVPPADTDAVADAWATNRSIPVPS